MVIRAYLGAEPVELGQVAPVMVNSYYVNYWNLLILLSQNLYTLRFRAYNAAEVEVV